MKNRIKVSVIMGIYNPADAGQFRQAVDSVISQTFQEWELIVCDDGSDGEYADVIREISARDPRIVLIRNQTNRGLGYSLNRCLELAQGKYIARMDGDDISKPERLEKEYIFLENHPQYQWVGCNSQLFHENGVWGEDRLPMIPEKEDF